MTRYSEDLQLMMKVMTGSMSHKLGLHDDVNISELNIFYMMNAGSKLIFGSVQKEIKAAIKKAVYYMRNTKKCKIAKFEYDGMVDTISMVASMYKDVKNLPKLMEEPLRPSVSELNIINTNLINPTILLHIIHTNY